MIIVYIWLPTKTSVGHAACHIVTTHGTGPSPYVSWHAKADGMDAWEAPAKIVGSLSEDRQTMGHWPAHVYKFEGLDEPAAREWWDSTSRRSALIYRLRQQNCAWTVHKVLEAAGAGRHLGAGHHVREGVRDLGMLGASPITLAASLMSLHDDGHLWLISQFADGFVPGMTTPADVNRYCIALKKALTP